MREFIAAIFLIGLVGLDFFNGYSARAERVHALSIRGQPKYDSTFSHFEYTNPQAPQGGRIVIGIVGTFDSLNPYCTRGIPAAGIGSFDSSLIFESLMQRSEDEPFTVYACLAESAEIAPDYSWVIFYLNPKARWADGRPVTAEDVYFTHELLKEKNHPHFRFLRHSVERCEVLTPLTVKFTFVPQNEAKERKFYDPELPLLIATGAVLPKHRLEEKDFPSLTREILVGSGPYRIASFEFGRSITFERRPEYWGQHLPIRKGMYNFKEIRFEYYFDDKVASEAFKAREFDFQIVQDLNHWHTNYHFSSNKKGKINKLELIHNRPLGMRGMILNTRKEKFSDPRVRRALLYASANFEEMNQRFYRGEFKRACSFFENTEFQASQEMSTLERSLANQLGIQVSETLSPLPKASTSKELRAYLLKAYQLLKSAGWSIQKGQLRNQKGEPFKIEVLLEDPQYKKVLLSFGKNLKILGIQLVIRDLDIAQYWHRVSNFDFDSLIFYWPGTDAPGREQKFRWSTEAAFTKSSLNYPGVRDQRIDTVINAIQQKKQETYVEYIAAVQLLDRLLLEGDYAIPLFHDLKHRIVYWGSLVHPPLDPGVGLSLANWWSNVTDQSSDPADQEAERP